MNDPGTLVIPNSGEKSAAGFAPLLALCTIPLISLVAVESGIASTIGVIFVVIGVATAVQAARLSFGSGETPTTIFVKVAACHALLGFVIAGPTSTVIWGSTNISAYYGPAFIVVASGLAASAIGYSVALKSPMRRLARFCSITQVDDRKLVLYARFLLLIGAAMMVTIYAKLGMLPLFSGNAGVARYFTEEVSDTYLRDEWLVNRALDLLTYTIPLVFCAGYWNRRRADFVVAGIGFLALLLPLRRANLMSVVVLSLVMLALRKGRLRIRARYVVIALLIIAVYAGSQLVFLGVITGGDADVRTSAAAIGSALPEIRDLAWIMSLTPGQYWYGITFIQPLVLLPSFISEFSQKNSLRALTTKLIGLDEDREGGGLRLTFPGEAFLNFSYFGPVIVGFFFGLACAYLDRSTAIWMEARELPGIYLAGLFFCWLCLWLYLAGTQAAATIKVGLIQTLVLFLASRRTPEETRAYECPI
jgi:oligosaccharide repeat unit polymerase